jgi:hypothetical protein
MRLVDRHLLAAVIDAPIPSMMVARTISPIRAIAELKEVEKGAPKPASIPVAPQDAAERRQVTVVFSGKAEADSRVERSLYQRAVGYSYDAVKIFMPAGAKKPVYAPYREHVPPDVTACIFWLKNRDPAHWREAWQVDHALGKYIISDQPMSEDEWIRERATMINVSPNQEDSGGQDQSDGAPH